MEYILLCLCIKFENKSYFEYSYIIKMAKMSEETITFAGRMGKPANDIKYTHIKYNGNEYTVMKIQHQFEYVYSIIDKEDFTKIKDYTWHYISGGYISHTIPVDESRRELYLHNLVMGRLGFPGKGSKESIDHINRNGLDNRKENLRLITQSEQNLNQTRKGRTITLPSDADIKVEDIPKHIWYIKANGHHGDRFGIDLKTENIKWKTTSAKNITLKDKLQAAIQQLKTYYTLYPYLNPENDETTLLRESMSHSYEEIIKLAE